MMVPNGQLCQVDDSMLTMGEQRIDLSCIHERLFIILQILTHPEPSRQDGTKFEDKLGLCMTIIRRRDN